MTEISIVIPCFNEENRLDISEIKQLFTQKNIANLIFVDDGSTDQTYRILSEIKNDYEDRVLIIYNKENKGKAEAVRQGMLYGLEKTNSKILGFLDADFFIPSEEVFRLISLFEKNTLFLFGSKYQSKYLTKKRKLYRRFFGEFFSKLVTLMIGIKVYDSQCGIKLFKRSIVTLLFKKPFITNWTFDVELFFRFKEKNNQNLKEIPLKKFNEAKESKMKISDFLIVPYELLKIFFYYKK